MGGDLETREGASGVACCLSGEAERSLPSGLCAGLRSQYRAARGRLLAQTSHSAGPYLCSFLVSSSPYAATVRLSLPGAGLGFRSWQVGHTDRALQRLKLSSS